MNRLQRAIARMLGINIKDSVSIDRAVIERLDALGATSWAGARVTHDSAIGISAVYACVCVLSESVAQLPLHVFRRTDEGREQATDHSLARLFEAPNAWQTPSEFWQMMMLHLTLRGNAYAFKARGVTGPVRELRPLHPDSVEVKQNDNLSLTYKVRLRDGTTREYPGSRIMHLRGLVQNGYMGLSPISAFRQGVGLALRQEEFAARFFRNGVRASGVLKTPPLGDKGLDELERRIDEKWSGAENAHGLIVVEAGQGDLSFSSLSMTNEDAQFIESRKFQTEEIARIFRVPLFLLQSTEKSTTWGTGLEQLSSAFVRFTLNPWLVKLEQAIKRDLIDETERGSVFAKFNTGALMRGEFKERQEGLAIQRQNGVISANEWRALEDRNPIDDGDDYTPAANLFGDRADAQAES